MKKILILSHDVLLGRVLSSELRRLGCLAKQYEPEKFCEIHPELFDLCILDASSPKAHAAESALLADQSLPLILLADSDYLKTRSTKEGNGLQHCCMQRPFLMEDFRHQILKMLQVLPPDNILTLPKTETFNPADYIRTDENSRTDFYQDTPVELTKKEFDLFCYLYENRGKILRRDHIFHDVWDYTYMGEGNIVDVYIRYLRSKIDDRFGIKLIHTVRGLGYTIKK